MTINLSAVRASGNARLINETKPVLSLLGGRETFPRAPWFRVLDANSLAELPIEVGLSPIHRFAWCSVDRVDLSAMPHLVRCQVAQHLLVIYEPGSFGDGYRQLESHRLQKAGLMDLGVDFIPANTSFTGRAEEGSRIRATVVALHGTPPGAARSISPDTSLGLQPALDLRGPVLTSIASRLVQVTQTAAEAVNQGYVEALLNVLALEVFTMLDEGRTLEGSRTSGGLNGRAKAILKDFIAANYSRRLDLDTLANLVGLSRFHFSRAFKESFGVPPHRYVLTVRIEQAAQLLYDRSIPITEIAHQVGFSSSSEFSRAFRGLKNCTPRELRERV